MDIRKLVRAKSTKYPLHAVPMGKQLATDLLSAKIVEESLEVARAVSETDLPNLVEELGDLLDIVDTIRLYHGLTVEAVEESRARKESARGGFDPLQYVSRPVLAGREPMQIPGLREVLELTPVPL